MPFYILVPVLAVIVLVGSAVGYRAYQAQKMVMTEEYTAAREDMPDFFKDEEETKPSSFFGSMFGGGGTPAVTPTPTPANAYDLARALDDTVDDGGTSDFAQLASDAEGL